MDMDKVCELIGLKEDLVLAQNTARRCELALSVQHPEHGPKSSMVKGHPWGIGCISFGTNEIQNVIAISNVNAEKVVMLTLEEQKQIIQDIKTKIDKEY